MLPAAAALVAALSLGQPWPRTHVERQAAPLAPLNAVRARAGLLPRKAPARTALARNGRRLVRVTATAPAFVGEPGTLPEVAAIDPAPAPGADAPAQDPGGLRASALGVTTDVTLSMRFDP